MQKVAWLITIIVIIAAGVVIWGIQSGKFFVEENSLPMSVKSVYQADNFYNIQAEYPQFKNADESFNKKISDLITEEIDNFKKEAKANWEARVETATPENPVPENPEEPFDFIGTWDSTQINDKYISFVINLYYYTGGAHGINIVYTFNYDIKQKKEISILDFLNSPQESLAKLATLTAQDIAWQLEIYDSTPNADFIKQMIEDGTKPTEENYKNFNFSYNALTIYFQQYQVAPGSAGIMKVTFYKNTLDTNSISSDCLK